MTIIIGYLENKSSVLYYNKKFTYSTDTDNLKNTERNLKSHIIVVKNSGIKENH